MLCYGASFTMLALALKSIQRASKRDLVECRDGDGRGRWRFAVDERLSWATVGGVVLIVTGS